MGGSLLRLGSGPAGAQGKAQTQCAGGRGEDRRASGSQCFEQLLLPPLPRASSLLKGGILNPFSVESFQFRNVNEAAGKRPYTDTLHTGTFKAER